MDPLSSLGSQANGGRYNAPGVGVLYTSRTKATAVAEVVRSLRTRGVNPKNFGPGDWWVYEIRVSLRNLVDLGDEATRSALGVTHQALVGENTVETRRIGKYALENGFEGLLAPSAAAKAEDNLVVFVDRLSGRPEVISSSPVDLAAVR